jgi:RHS repeat-associated protein
MPYFSSMEYSPYGEQWIDEGADRSVIGYRFTSKELDTETGLYYFGARYMDPTTSKWMSADPAFITYLPERPKDIQTRTQNEKLPGAGGVFNPINLSLYNYANNNPLRYVDPAGTDVGDKSEYAGRDLNAPPATQGQAPQQPAQPQPQNAPQLLSQNSPALAGISNMAQSGCYFRSCEAVAERETGQALSAEQITAAVGALQASGAVTAEMKVQNPDAVINDAFARLGHSNITATVNWGGGTSAASYTIVRGVTPLHHEHYRLGDSSGDVTWDPYSPAVVPTTVGRVLPVYIHRRD